MRMWMLPPHLLCRKHLLGEHNELHKHLPSLRRGIRLDGRYADKPQLELCSYEQRHADLVTEMLNRNYNHKSPLIDVPDFRILYPQYYYIKVDLNYNLNDLKSRCADCAERIGDYQNGNLPLECAYTVCRYPNCCCPDYVGRR